MVPYKRASTSAVHIARAWVVLGAVITEAMGLHAPAGLLGIHTNMPGIFPAWEQPQLFTAELRAGFKQLRE